MRAPPSPSLFLGCLSLCLLSACGSGGAVGNDGSPGGPESPGAGKGLLQVRMHDAPVDDADNVFVTVDRVEVFRSDGGSEIKETLVDTPAQYDLLALQNGVEAVLGTGEFPAGEYRSIRLIIAADSRDDIDTLPAEDLNNYIVIDGETFPLIVPSGAQTGIKFNHHFTISEGEIKILTFDFDVRQSVHQRGHQGIFNLRPTLRLIDTVADFGTISGNVSIEDASPIAGGTVVSAQQAGVEVASAGVDTATGDYEIGPLAPGTYDLVVIAPGFAFASETGVAVVAGLDSPGHDFVLVPSDVGDIDGTVAFTTTLPETVTVRLSSNGLLVGTTGIDTTTGFYVFPGIPVGTYDVVATDGTATDTVTGVSVTGGAVTTVPLTLP
jgi:hypothetical protein